MRVAFMIAGALLMSAMAFASEPIEPDRTPPDWGPIDPRPDAFQRTRDSVMSDAFLRGRILTEIFSDPGVDVFSIRVRVESSEVGIRGMGAGGTASAFRAGEIAAKTRGVRSVEVTPGGSGKVPSAGAESASVPPGLPAERRDAWLRRQIRSRVLTSVQAPVHDLEVRGGKEGIVLSGSADRLSTLKEAQHAAEEVVGAGRVRSSMVVSLHRSVSDAALERAIARLIELDPEISRLDAKVTVRAGVARVQADWVWEAERRAIDEFLSQVAGIRAIEGLERDP